MDEIKKKQGMPTVISTFCGAGGSSLGYKMAGFNELLATDWDDNSEEMFKLNFPEMPFLKADISKMHENELLNMANLETGELDVLDGSPPCQGFSISGKRKFNDSRNRLFEAYIRQLKGLKPKSFIMENVVGITTGKMKNIYAEIISELKLSGYDVKAKILCASNYGVPQSRRRVFIIGFRKDLQIKENEWFPEHIDKLIPAGLAICGADTDEHIKLNNKSLDVWWRIKPGQNGSKVKKNNWFNFIKLNPAKPAPTILKSFHCNSSFMNGLFHWAEPRSMSIGEVKRLCSFPDEFKFTGKFKDKWARMGNAVMPLQMKAIASRVKEILEATT